MEKEVRVTVSYVSEHPTQFNFAPSVKRRVRDIQRAHPWQLFACTYWDHPPGDGKWPVNYYTRLSVDFWGGGGTGPGNYSGYRGKPLPKALGDQVWRELFYADSGPAIDWIIWQGWMWWAPATGGPGWTSAPGGPADSDPGHYGHIHVTYQ